MDPGVLFLIGFVGLLSLLGAVGLRTSTRTQRSKEKPTAPEPHRFLCPKCLHFGLFRHACGSCGSPIDPLVSNTGGHLANTCSVCKRPLFRRGRRRGPAPLATCRHCGEACDPTVYHERSVQLVGVLCDGDYQEFRKQAGLGWTFRREHAVFDAGKVLVYVVNLTACDSSAGSADSQHAQDHLNALWFGPSLAEPLTLGEALDRFLRRSSNERSTEHLRVLAGDEHTESAGANVLSGRFPRAEYGVTPAKLGSTLRGENSRPAGSGPLTLAVLTEADFARLSATTDLSGKPILNRTGQGRSPRHGPLRLACAERASSDPGPSRESLAGTKAVWIGEAPLDVEGLESRIQWLFRELGLPQSRAEGLLACLESPHPHAAATALLESRFGRVEVGVPAAEFLARGPEARGWILTGRAPVRTRAVLNATDLWVVGEAMDPRHRHDLGGGWLCEATPARVNYVLNLDAPDRTPGSFFATPEPGEIEAVWIHLAAREPLGLAEYLDRMDRIPGLGSAERDDVTACISRTDLPPAVRNVLEARFTRIGCGVSAEDFLNGSVGSQALGVKTEPAVDSGSTSNSSHSEPIGELR